MCMEIIKKVHDNGHFGIEKSNSAYKGRILHSKISRKVGKVCEICSVWGDRRTDTDKGDVTLFH